MSYALQKTYGSVTFLCACGGVGVHEVEGNKEIHFSSCEGTELCMRVRVKTCACV